MKIVSGDKNSQSMFLSQPSLADTNL